MANDYYLPPTAYNDKRYKAQNSTGNTAYGTVPKPVDLATSQAAAIAANQANLGAMEQQAAQLNAFNQQQLLNQYRGLNPAFDASYAQAGQNARGMLAGQLPPDVIRQLQQNSAEFGLNAGVSGSQLQSYQGLRALGLNSLDLMNRGQANLLSLTSGTPTAGLSNPQSSFITPGQQQESAVYNAALAAAPDPQKAAENALAIARQAQIQPGATGGRSVNPAGISRPTSSSITSDIISRYASPMNPTGYMSGTQYGTAREQPAAINTGDGWNSYNAPESNYGTAGEAVRAGGADYWSDINALDNAAFDDLIASLV